jgi:hypothetical protein
MYPRSLSVSVLVAVIWSLSFLTAAQKAPPQTLPKNGGDFSNNTQPLTKVPAGVILVKGAWSSASDSATPTPEDGKINNDIFTSQYFGMTYTLSPNWTEKYEGPPPSDSGRYVLAQISPSRTYQGSNRGTILITAQDMFFTPFPATNASELVNYTKANLQPDYKVELPPTQLKIAGHSFSFFAYESPVAQLHWYIVATEIRCHVVEIVLTSRDTKLLETLLLDLNKMKLPGEASPAEGKGGGDFPLCLNNYARDETMIARIEPVFTEHRFNPVPVRIIIDKGGKIRHIHFLSAFADQAKAITDALGKWKFKPYLQNGHPVEVETGIMFGRPPFPTTTQAKGEATE